MTIWKKTSDDSWELVEELSDDLALAGRLEELRLDGNEYRAENFQGFSSSVLGV